MILQNVSRWAEMPYRQAGGAFTDAVTCWGHRAETHLNKYAGDAGLGIPAINGIPTGYLHPSSWGMPIKPGGLGAHKSVAGEAIEFLVNLAAGLGGEASIAGTGIISTAIGQLVVGAIATITASGGFASAPSIAGKLDAAATLAGEGDLTGSLGAIVDAVTLLQGIGSVDADLIADGFMAALVTTETGDLTYSGIAQSVWSAVAEDNNEPGSTGAKLNAAGAAGDPWVAELPGTYPAGSAGSIMAKIFSISKVLLGLGK